jgi:hypothetical protein
MKLNLSLRENKKYSFWMTRSQWLNLIFLLQPLLKKSKKKLPKEESIEPKKELKSASNNENELETQLVKAIKYRVLDEGVALAIVTTQKEVVSIQLKNQDIEAFSTMLLDTAEKVGWEPFPALKRLKVNQNAKQAIKSIMNKPYH